MTPERYTTGEQFGSLVYELREDAYLTQAQLADILGVAQSEVSRWEHGHILPGRRVMARLESFAPGFYQEMRFLWLRGRWEKFHAKPRPKPQDAPGQQEADENAATWQMPEGET
jgi:transcriptional regulator with XRE-family HTH domain